MPACRVLIPGAAAPKQVTRSMIATMKGAVVVDVAVDQGGCIETTHVGPPRVDGPGCRPFGL